MKTLGRKGDPFYLLKCFKRHAEACLSFTIMLYSPVLFNYFLLIALMCLCASRLALSLFLVFPDRFGWFLLSFQPCLLLLSLLQRPLLDFTTQCRGMRAHWLVEEVLFIKIITMTTTNKVNKWEKETDFIQILIISCYYFLSSNYRKSASFPVVQFSLSF